MPWHWIHPFSGDTRMLGYGLVLLALMSATVADPDPCQAGNHVTINDPTRYTTYVTDTTAARCDNELVMQWYRVPFGSVATTPPPINRCGTAYPVWIQPETLPSTGQSQLVTICLRTAHAVCYATGNIAVKNCGSFYVYELRQLNSNYCPLAYCLETDSSTTVLPSVSASLVEGTAIIESTEFRSKEILFTCDLEANTGVDLTALYYDVVWYINDQDVARRTDLSYSAYITDGVLRETDWKLQYSLAMQVKCSVEAKSGVATGTGNFENSAPFYAGFTAELSGDFLPENGELELTIQLTVPLGCTYLPNTPENKVVEHENRVCRMQIQVVTPGDNSATDQCTRGGVINNAITYKNKDCGVHIYHTSWDTAVVMKIHGAPDNIVNSGHRMTLIKLQSDVFVHAHTIWNAVVKEIEVHVHDDDINIMGKLCYSSNDPHMKTFDGMTYELQKTGEYAMYTYDNLSIAIHAYFQPCNWGWPNAKCNCGIAIRSGNTVFRANFCKHSTGYNRIVEFNGCDQDNMQIKSYQSIHRYGSGYMITLPTGTVVTFRYGSYGDAVFIHFIHIKPSIMDWEVSAGLCGYMDGSTANDFKQRDGSQASNAAVFSDSWKITLDVESLFINQTLVTEATTFPYEYCTCKDDDNNVLDEDISCSASPAEPCTSSDSDASTGYLNTCWRSLRRKKRNADKEMVYFPWYPNLDESNDTESGVPEWSGNWTEVSAAEACREFLGASPLIQKCEEVIPGFDSDAYVPDCTRDIKLTGSTLFMESTLSLLQTACVAEAVRLENLTKDETGSGTSVLDEMLALSCSNNCSNAGACINGTCQCETGYEGADCSLSGNDPPSLSQETNVGLCNSSQYVCSKYLISGENFMPTHLTCKARPFKVYDTSMQMEGDILTFSGIYVNSFTCICKIPASPRRRRSTSDHMASGYQISVSNDGTTFSTEVTFINFDGRCYDCNITSVTCTEKTEGCSNTVNDDSYTAVNDAPSGKSDNSHIAVNDALSETTLVISVAVPIGILLVTVAIGCCIMKHYQTNSTTVESLSNLRSEDEKVPPSESDLFAHNGTEVIIGTRPIFQTLSKENDDIVIYDL